MGKSVGGVSVPPPRLDGKEAFRCALQHEVLTRVGFDLQAQGQGRDVLGIEPVDDRDASFRLFVARLTEPGIEYVTQRVHHGTRRHSLRLDKIDVFRVPRYR